MSPEAREGAVAALIGLAVAGLVLALLAWMAAG